MTRVRPTARLLLGPRPGLLPGLLLAVALTGGCSEKDPTTGEAQSAPSPSPTASATPEEPKLSARQTLAQALDRMEEADLQGFVETVRAEHVAAVSSVGVVRLGTGELHASARLMDPRHTERTITVAATLTGRQGYLQSSQFGAEMKGCWVRMAPAQLHGPPGIIARSLGLDAVQALRSVSVTGIDRFHEQLHGRLSLDRAVLLFAPVLLDDLVGGPAPGLTGSVPVTVTVADGEVLHWEASGTDVSRAVVAAVGDRMPTVSRIVGTEFAQQFMEAGPHDQIAAPADEDIAVSPAGCHGTAA